MTGSIDCKEILDVQREELCRKIESMLQYAELASTPIEVSRTLIGIMQHLRELIDKLRDDERNTTIAKTEKDEIFELFERWNGFHWLPIAFEDIKVEDVIRKTREPAYHFTVEALNHNSDPPSCEVNPIVDSSCPKEPRRPRGLSTGDDVNKLPPLTSICPECGAGPKAQDDDEETCIFCQHRRHGTEVCNVDGCRCNGSLDRANTVAPERFGQSLSLEAELNIHRVRFAEAQRRLTDVRSWYEKKFKQLTQERNAAWAAAHDEES